MAQRFIEVTIASTGDKIWLNINNVTRFHIVREPGLNLMEKTVLWTGTYQPGSDGDQDENGEFYYVVEETVEELMGLIKRGDVNAHGVNAQRNRSSAFN